MSHRYYPPCEPLLIGYDPAVDIPLDHLARFVDMVVDEVVPAGSQESRPGRPAFHLRLCIKVLVFGFSTGIRSSRQLERLCAEHLAYLMLTRGDTPCYRTLCSVRTQNKDLLEQVWLTLIEIAGRNGLKRMGRIVIDSSKFRADVSSESIINDHHYDAMLSELKRIVEEAERIDHREEVEGGGSQTLLGKEVPGDQMRDIIRSVRSRLASEKRKAEALAAAKAESTQADAAKAESTQATCENVEATDTQDIADDIRKPVHISGRMLERVKLGIAAIESAIADGRKHQSLTDPDARMMPEGSGKRIKECYSFEIAVDAGLIVAGSATQCPNDTSRLLPLFEAAKPQEPEGIVSVDADSGYYSGDAVATLARKGVDTCIPDNLTASDLHHGDEIGTAYRRQNGKVEFHYDAENDCFTCPGQNVLRFKQERESHGSTVRVYVAERACTDCPLAAACMKNKGAKRREVQRSVEHVRLKELLENFTKPEHIERYNNRGPRVETVFGFIRSVLGYHRWTLRGKDRVACEAELFKIGYQVRKIFPVWKANQVNVVRTR